jgi:hypothetical protein
MTISRSSCTIPYSSYLQPGWPTNWEDFDTFIPYEGTSNACKDCTSLENPECRRNKQSPINLDRNVTAIRECKDRHRMNFETGSCEVHKMDFQILPHGKKSISLIGTCCDWILTQPLSFYAPVVLRAYQPESCGAQPNIDFSRGFPDPWYLSFTDISVPSQHVQGGKRYAAEVVLSHVYSKDKSDKYVSSQLSSFVMF